MESGQLNIYMRLKESGELKIDSNYLRVSCTAVKNLTTLLDRYLTLHMYPQNLNQDICRLTKCDNIEEAFMKLRKESRIKFRIKSNYLPELFSVSNGLVKQWTRSMSLVSVPGLYSDLDLERGKYEGGFKVWESTRDLVKFITEDNSVIGELLQRQSKKFKALELGAGASLPSLALLNRLIEDQNFTSDYRIHCQDYNWQVLASLTLLNFAANLPRSYFEALVESKCLRFFHGDWKDFKKQSSYKYDLIMMSEVLYNSENYDSLFNLLNRHLKRNGYILIATKNTYFGLSGGLYSWLDYLDAKNVFRMYKLIHVSLSNIPRTIIVMKRSA